MCNIPTLPLSKPQKGKYYRVPTVTLIFHHWGEGGRGSLSLKMKPVKTIFCHVSDKLPISLLLLFGNKRHFAVVVVVAVLLFDPLSFVPSSITAAIWMEILLVLLKAPLLLSTH